MKVLALSKPDQNEAAIDPWTAVHLAAGLASGLMGFSLLGSLVAAGTYEAFEQAIERTEGGQKFFKTSGPEHPANVVVDLLVFAGGNALGQLWNGTAPAAPPFKLAPWSGSTPSQ